MMSMRRSLALIAVASLMMVGCDKPTGSVPGPGGGPGAVPPTPEVSVLVVKAENVPITRDLVGRLAATRTAQVRARVAGIVLERVYTEGTDVQRGQVLFRIDPARLEARLRAEEAALARAEADAANAALTAKRYMDLRERKTLSQQDLDTAQAAERTTAAAVQQARANVETARLDLGYATVTAPIAGRAGRALVTEGALVGEGEVTPLTMVEHIDPIYVNFGLSMQQVIELQQAVTPAGMVGLRSVSKFQVQVLSPDGTPAGSPGSLDFSDLAVDPNTGALSLRATLANPDKALLPGMFVSLRLTAGALESAFVLPQAALARDPQGAYVMVVDAASTVQQRRVETHGMTRTDWVLTGDLKDGDQVIVAGLQKVKPNALAKVAPMTGPAVGPGTPQTPGASAAGPKG